MLGFPGESAGCLGKEEVRAASHPFQAVAASSIVAHMIIGRKTEAYLSAALESIADVCDHVVVNDNSAGQGEHNAELVSRSRLARSGRVTVIHTVFKDFASARNACLDATPLAYSRGWALFVDADEVHGGELAEMAALLSALPDDVDAVDGYSRHFVGSFSWWIAMGRRLCFFRLAASRRWYGKVHERLAPLRRRVVLPAVWFHYGHVVTPTAEAEKSRLYASLDTSKVSP
ncbi:MAG: glycosyltransferase, partial [Candidatus Eremiobacteraeota bacterium]|nr:glycosyltransferase [Candidatus Eremiobacteraeota bacterium]